MTKTTTFRRELKPYRQWLEPINLRRSELKKTSDDHLKNIAKALKKLACGGVSPDDLLVEAFALACEVSRRVLPMDPFDVQVAAAIVMYRGNLAEMQTGEGKTLAAVLPVYPEALTGKGVHVLTFNDYLARRDAQWMGPIYEFLGLSVGVILHELNDQERKAAYNCDITYGTNNEFGFDYLRDNMKFDINDYVQRDLNYAIVDEVDSILVDEARTPLIISGPAEESTDKYYRINQVIPRLKKEHDYTMDEKSRTVVLTEEIVEQVRSDLMRRIAETGIERQTYDILFGDYHDEFARY